MGAVRLYTWVFIGHSKVWVGECLGLLFDPNISGDIVAWQEVLQSQILLVILFCYVTDLLIGSNFDNMGRYLSTGLHNFHILPHMCLIAHISTHQLIIFLPTNVDEKSYVWTLKEIPTLVKIVPSIRHISLRVMQPCCLPTQKNLNLNLPFSNWHFGLGLIDP